MQVPGQTLRIDAIDVLGAGLIGMCCCPGRLEPASRGGYQSRNLEDDLAVLTDWSPGTVISLIEQREFDLLGVPGLPQRLQSLPLEWHHCPITDLGAPGGLFETLFAQLEIRLLVDLSKGGRVLLHCAAGLGRAGTIAARLLIHAGEAPAQAIARVRAARPGAIESAHQERYLASLSAGGNVLPG